MLSKTGMNVNKLTQDQIKKMQAGLGGMASGPKNKLTVARVRSLLEVAQPKWRKRVSLPRNMHLIFQKVFTVYMQKKSYDSAFL